MIGVTKLLCGQATAMEAERQQAAGRTAPHLLQFTGNGRALVIWNVTYRCNPASSGGT